MILANSQTWVGMCTLAFGIRYKGVSHSDLAVTRCSDDRVAISYQVKVGITMSEETKIEDILRLAALTHSVSICAVHT